MNPQLCGPLIFSKAGKNIQWEKVSSTNGVGKTEQPHAKDETRPLSYTTHKKKLKMNVRSKCE